MAKKATSTAVTSAPAKPAVRRTRTTKTTTTAAKASPVRRASTRSRKAEGIADDRGIPASVPAAALVAAEPTHDEIATRAYFVHLRRAGAPGNPEQDWLLALDEIRRERGL